MSEKHFPTVQRSQKLSDQVTGSIREMILSGELAQGERLPAERELADRFDVSRTVIREAVRSLIAQGLVEVYAGSGMIVSAPKTSVLSESMGLILRLNSTQDFFTSVQEVRFVLETEIARLAAQRGTDEDIHDLETHVETLRTHFGDINACAEADVEFHAALARATHNELFVILLDSVVDIMLELRIRALEIQETWASALNSHTQILECVRAHDADGAQSAMIHHLREGYEQIRSLGER